MIKQNVLTQTRGMKKPASLVVYTLLLIMISFFYNISYAQSTCKSIGSIKR